MLRREIALERYGRETVVVAMSGGVDSSAAAGLLLRRGCRVIGATLLMSRDGAARDASGAAAQARAVAQALGVEHRTVDCADAFREEVLAPAWREYDRGRTPSPCVVCNDRIKLRILSALADEVGAGRIATGHYARVEPDPDGRGVALLRGVDADKDQSYFLHALAPGHLARALFPLGALTKPEVRALARDMGLPNAERAESQDACFAGDGDGFAEALRLSFGGRARGGAIVRPDGTELGRHDGLHRFTIGQRKGLKVALGGRAYVCRIEGDTGRVVLSDDPAMLESDGLEATGFRWSGGAPPSGPFRCEAQIRYRHRAVKTTAEILGGGLLRVRFDEKVRAVAPGQAVVLYRGDRVLGGGWIERGLREGTP
jgi:tRNA-uridine 2-sulfurtransferase